MWPPTRPFEQQPYDDPKGKRTKTPRNEVSPPSPRSISPSSSKPGLGTGAVLFCNLCIWKIRKHYPGIEPRSDFELARLSERRFKGSPTEICAQLDKDLAMSVSAGGYEFIMQAATALLDSYVEPSEVEPGCSAHLNDDEKFILVYPILDSEYSVRLFPGSITAAEYCLVFVDSATWQPVNSPFEFELTRRTDVCAGASGEAVSPLYGARAKDGYPGCGR